MSFPYDATNVEPSQFDIVPNGKYQCVITKTEETWSKAGDPQIIVTLEVDDKQHNGKKLWHRITFLPPESKGSGIAVHFLKSIMEPYSGKFTVDPSNWIGKYLICQVAVTKNPNTGRDKNEISAVYPSNLPPKKIEKTEDSDNVPF